MSAGKGSKRVSVFDRLGPGADEPSPSHRRYSADKHSSTSSSQDKARSHAYGAVRMEDRDGRDRKARHRGSDYSSSLADGKMKEDKRASNPPSLKASRDASEVLKGIAVKSIPGTGSGESDCESGEDGNRRRSYHGDHESCRGEHGADSTEEDSSRKRGKDKEKAYSHSERVSSHHRSPPPSDKPRSRRDPGSRKDEEGKISELGHKRKRDHFEDGHLHESKRARHGDHHGSRDRESDHYHSSRDKEGDYHHGSRDREGDHHHGNRDRESDHHYSSKDSDHLYSSADKKWRQDGSGSELSSRKQHHSGVTRSGGERGRERDRGSSRTHRHSSRESKKVSTAAQEKEHFRGHEGRSRNLDWAVVNTYTQKANAKLKYQFPVAVLKKFTPSASLARVAVTPSLAGPWRYQRILELVKSHFEECGEDGLSKEWLEALQERGIVPLKSDTEWNKAVVESLGPCRRALTAADDYALRRLLRKELSGRYVGPVGTAASNSWATSQYQVALNFYNTLPMKPSGKPANRLQPSKVGTLVL